MVSIKMGKHNLTTRDADPSFI